MADSATLDASHDREEADGGEADVLLNEPEPPEARRTEDTRMLIYALPALLLCTFVARFDSSYVSGNYSRRIAAELHEFNNARWLVLGFLVTESSLNPLYGHAAQIYGHRKVLLFAATALCIGIILCSLSHHLWQLALSRVVVGTGAGGIAVLVTVIMNDLVQLHKLPLWTSTIAVSETLGLMLGVPLGAALNDALGFQLTFAIEACCMGLAILVMYTTVRLPQADRRSAKGAASRLEWPSALMLLFSIAAPLFAINLGGEIFAWSHPLMIALLCATPVFMTLLYYADTRIAITPILPRRFLRNRDIGIAFLCILPMKFVFDQLRFSFGTYLEARSFNGESTFSDWALTCIYLGRPAGTIICGVLIARYRRFKPFLQLTILADVLIFVCFASASIHPEQPAFAPVLFFIGAVEGIAESLWLVAVLSLVSDEDQPLLFAFFMTAVAVAGDLGIAISLATESSLFRARLQSRLSGYDGADEIIRKTLKDLKYIRELPLDVQTTILDALVSSVETAFAISCFVLAISVVSNIFMKEMPRSRRNVL